MRVVVDNGINAEGAKALAASLEANTTLMILNLCGKYVAVLVVAPASIWNCVHATRVVVVWL